MDELPNWVFDVAWIVLMASITHRIIGSIIKTLKETKRIKAETKRLREEREKLQQHE